MSAIVDLHPAGDAPATAGMQACRLPVAAIAAAVIIVALECFLLANRHRLMDGIEANFFAKMAIMEDPSDPADEVAIFGDSKFFSVRPDAIADALGGGVRVTNYSWPFFGVEAYELMLSNYLRHRPAPRAIIVNGRPELIGAPAARNSLADLPAHRARAFGALPLRDITALAIHQRRPSLLWHRFAWAFVPLSSVYQGAAWDAFRDLVRGRGWPEPDKDYQRMTTSFRDTGAFLMHRNRQVALDEINALEQIEGPYGIHMNERQIASFDRFLARAAGAGIAVFVLGSPAPPPFHDRFEQLGIQSAYRALFAQWTEKYLNLHVVEPLHPVYPLDHFGDAGHLNTRGDTQFQATYPSLIAPLVKFIKKGSLS